MGKKHMVASEIHPIPEGSVVTEAMLDAWCKYYKIADEESQRPGVLSSLLSLASGVGKMPSKLVNGNDIFAPLRAAYCKAKGVDEPADWSNPIVDVEGEKLPEAETPST